MESTSKPKSVPVPSLLVAFYMFRFNWIHSCCHLEHQSFDVKTLCGNFWGCHAQLGSVVSLPGISRTCSHRKQELFFIHCVCPVKLDIVILRLKQIN